MNFINKDKDGLASNIFTAYAILLLHLALLVGAGVAVVLFKGVYHYLPWIMACIGILAVAGAFVFYQRLKTNTSDIGNFLSRKGLENRTIDVKLIGGLASFRISPSPKENGQLSLDQKASESTPVHLLGETADDETEQKILRLIALFEKDLITIEEFEKAKQKILQG